MEKLLNLFTGGSGQENPMMLPESKWDVETANGIKSMEGRSSSDEKPLHRRNIKKSTPFWSASDSITGYDADDDGDGSSSEDEDDSIDLNSSDLDEDEDEYSSDESSDDGPFSFAELPIIDILTSRTMDDGTIRITYVSGNSVYICTTKSNFGIFLENHRQEIRKKCSLREGSVTMVKTKSTAKGVLIDSIRIETEKDRKERAMQMKNFHRRTGFHEHVPDYYVNMKIWKQSDDEDDSEAEGSEDVEDVRVVVDPQSLVDFHRRLNEERGGSDMATITSSIPDKLKGKEPDIETQAIDLGDSLAHPHMKVAVDLLSADPSQHSTPDVHHTHQREEAVTNIRSSSDSEIIPSEERGYISMIKREERRERAKAVLTGILRTEDTYYVASESEYLIYCRIISYNGGVLFPFITQTKAFCQGLRKKRLYGTSALNNYRKFMNQTMVPSDRYVPPEDIGELLTKRGYRDVTLMKEETSEESGSSTTRPPSQVDKFLESKETPSFRLSKTKEILEGDKVKEKWDKVIEKCKEDGDSIPLSISVMEAICAQWEEASSFSISLFEAYQNLFAITSCIEKEVLATTEIHQQMQDGGVLVSTQQFKALTNAMACIRNRKANIIRSTFEGR